MRSVRLMIVMVCATALAACGADADDSLSASTTTLAPQPTSEATFPANGEQAAITALDNNFLPQEVTVVAGTEVVFTNNGRNPHNLLPADDPKATTWGVLETAFLPKDVYSHVFDRPGTYVYYCSIHGTPKAAMFGTITVTAP
jgi:plastocyanin